MCISLTPTDSVTSDFWCTWFSEAPVFGHQPERRALHIPLSRRAHSQCAPRWWSHSPYDSASNSGAGAALIRSTRLPTRTKIRCKNITGTQSCKPKRDASTANALWPSGSPSISRLRHCEPQQALRESAPIQVADQPAQAYRWLYAPARACAPYRHLECP